jgi:hypothetical protein
MPDGLPPGIHLEATFVCGERRHLRFPVRLLGDDERGYLVAGLPRLPELENVEVWFPTLASALDTGESLGIDRTDWAEFTPAPAL